MMTKERTDYNMDTIIMNTNDRGAISRGAEILRAGGLVAFPTETVYGLGADGLNAEAAAKIYAAKGRPSDNPLILHIADTAAVYQLASEVPEVAKALMEAFWPGPLTIIFKKKDLVPLGTTGGLNTVAIRFPSHPGARRLIQESGVYIAAPSANTSGRPSPTTAAHVIEDMNGRIDMILDGGPVGIGIESTIVDVTGQVPTILRPGYITKAMLEQIAGPVEIDRALIEPDPNLRPKAPGMKYTHYAPKGSLTIVEATATPAVVTKNVVDKINQLVQYKEEKGATVAVLTTSDMAASYHCKNIVLLGSHGDGATVAARLYAALRECDALQADFIYSESFHRDELGGAIMNRLLKAAGHKVVSV